MALNETRLTAAIFAGLQAQEAALKANPTETPQASQQRLAAMLAKCVIDEMKLGGDVVGQAAGPGGTFAVTAKIT